MSIRHTLFWKQTELSRSKLVDRNEPTIRWRKWTHGPKVNRISLIKRADSLTANLLDGIGAPQGLWHVVQFFYNFIRSSLFHAFRWTLCFKIALLSSNWIPIDRRKTQSFTLWVLQKYSFFYGDKANGSTRNRKCAGPALQVKPCSRRFSRVPCSKLVLTLYIQNTMSLTQFQCQSVKYWHPTA